MERLQGETWRDDQKPSVLMSVTNTGWIHKLVVRSLFPILSDSRYVVRYIDPTWVPYENAMNRIAKDFLDSDFDYWLHIDSDNPPQHNPLDLIELDRDIIGLPTPIYHNKDDGEWPICWNALDWDDIEKGYREHHPRAGLQQVDAIGSGCMIVARRVIETLPPPWFVRQTDEYGRVTFGPDFTFCGNAVNAGFEVWAHYDYFCEHVNEICLVEAIGGFSGIGKDASCSRPES